MTTTISRRPITTPLSRRWIAVLAAVLGLAAIIAGQLGPNRYRMEDELAQRARAALTAAGQPHTSVSFAGRDGLIVAGSQAEADGARTVVAAVDGVRTVKTQVLAPATGTNPGQTAPGTNPGQPAAGVAPGETGAGVGPVDAAAAATRERLTAAAERARAELGERQEAMAVQQQLEDLASLTFETGGARLTSDSRAALREVAGLMAVNPGFGLRVGGHTDSRGPAETNLALSRERAAAVKDALVEYGVDADRLTAKGYGEAHPAVPNDTPGHRAANRRVELVVYSR